MPWFLVQSVLFPVLGQTSVAKLRIDFLAGRSHQETAAGYQNHLGAVLAVLRDLRRVVGQDPIGEQRYAPCDNRGPHDPAEKFHRPMSPGSGVISPAIRRS